MEFIEYPDQDALFMRLAGRLSSEIGETLRSETSAAIAVPGGTTPGPVFDLLSAAPLDWERVTVMPTDERWVPESSERSNAALIRTRLLTGPAARARYLPFWQPDATPAEALPALSAAVEARTPLSLVLLGMGADMHTASLFPGARGLAEALAADAPALCAIEAEAAVELRLTLSARVLASALRIHILIIGDRKREALEAARSLPAEAAPVRAVLAGATVHWAA